MGTYNGCLLIPLTALQDLSYESTACRSLGPRQASQWVTLIHLLPPPCPFPLHTHGHKISHTHKYEDEHILTHAESYWPTQFRHTPLLYNGGYLFKMFSSYQIYFPVSGLHFVLLSPCYISSPLILSLLVPTRPTPCSSPPASPPPRSCADSSRVLLGDPSLSAC